MPSVKIGILLIQRETLHGFTSQGDRRLISISGVNATYSDSIASDPPRVQTLQKGGFSERVGEGLGYDDPMVGVEGDKFRVHGHIPNTDTPFAAFHFFAQDGMAKIWIRVQLPHFEFTNRRHSGHKQ